MRPSQTTWTTIAPNIADDGLRYVATASIGRTRRRRKRFPRTTPIRTITDWIRDTCAELRSERRTSQRLKGKLAGEIAAYVARLPTGSKRTNTLGDLRAWILALGDVKRPSLRAERLQQVMTDWIDAGVAASTLKKRRRSLAQFLERAGDHTLARTVRTLQTPREPKTPPRGADMDVLHAAISAMHVDASPRNRRGHRPIFRNQARARLLLWLWTGAEPATQERIAPTDIDLVRGTITLPPREKGEGVPGITLRFVGHGALAAQEWLRAQAWGPNTASAIRRAFHAAIRAYIAREAAAGRTVTVPADLKPKHLRHSFLCWLLEHCELDIVQQYAQHLHIETTQRYTQRVVPKRLSAAADRINAAFAAGREVA